MKYTLENKAAQITYTDCVLKFKINLHISLITNQITWIILN